MCDACSRTICGVSAERRDIAEAAAAITRTLAEWPAAEKRATLLQLIDRWRASKVSAFSPSTQHFKFMPCYHGIMLECMQLAAADRTTANLAR